MEQPVPSSPSLTPSSPSLDTNPLRMLRSGAFPIVRPRVRGNKHHSGNQPQQQSPTVQHQHSDSQASATTSSRSLPRLRVPPPPSTAPPPIPIETPGSFISAPMPLSRNFLTRVSSSDSKDCSGFEEMVKINGDQPLSTTDTFKSHQNIALEPSLNAEVSEDTMVICADNTDEEGETVEGNPIPLPPRDRSRPLPPTKPRHQRKHPLIIPGGGVTRTLAKMAEAEIEYTATEVAPQYLGLQTGSQIMPEESEDVAPDQAKSPFRTSR